MGRKLLTTIVVAMLLAPVAVISAGANQTVECDGKYPVYHDLAQTEQEQAARIACLNDRLEPKRERISELRDKREAKAERIAELRAERQRMARTIDRIQQDIAPIVRVVRILRYVVGDVVWVYTTAFCESGGTMQTDIHNSTGKYHSFGQFDLPTAREASIFEGRDPHLFYAIEIAHGMVEVKRETSDERWPVCGD